MLAWTCMEHCAAHLGVTWHMMSLSAVWINQLQLSDSLLCVGVQASSSVPGPPSTFLCLSLQPHQMALFWYQRSFFSDQCLSPNLCGTIQTTSITFIALGIFRDWFPWHMHMCVHVHSDHDAHVYRTSFFLTFTHPTTQAQKQYFFNTLELGFSTVAVDKKQGLWYVEDHLQNPYLLHLST